MLTPHLTMSSAFEEHARLIPERAALCCPNEALTYGELNDGANRIAHRILDLLGDGEEPVVIFGDHGIEMIAAILGTLKAGKICVPLDVSWPQARLAAMLENSQAQVIFATAENERLAHDLIGDRGHVISSRETQRKVGTGNPGLSYPADRLAYLIYTSGSTGAPKGIVHSHRTVLHNIANYTQLLGIRSTDRLTGLHSPSFSSGLVDIFLALFNGATLYLWDVRKRGLHGLGAWLNREQITVFNWAPTPYRQLLLSLGENTILESPRLLVLGGEPVTKRDWQLYCRQFPDSCRLVNRLGSTETNNYRLNFIGKSSEPPGGTIPCGYPVPDKDVLVVDDHGMPVGPNTVGQIVVCSRFLSPGYWRRPDLTDRVFHPDPADATIRRYLTGDLGLLRSDGCLEFIGRADTEVKVHGHRIDLAEVEVALAAHKEVRDAVVAVRPGSDGEGRLVAYFVPRTEAPSPTELRRFLQDHLPSFMVPSAYVSIEALPLTPTGKLNRAALPMPDPLMSTRQAGSAPPRTPSEKRLAVIWQEVLGVAPIGAEDDFFDLGGNSLQVMRVVAVVREAFGADISPRTLFEAPTLAGLASWLETASPLEAGVHAAPSLTPATHDGPPVLSFAQERLWFLSQLEPGITAYNIPIVFRLRGALDLDSMRRALTEIIRRHQVLRAAFRTVEGRPVQFVTDSDKIRLASVDLSGLPAPESEAIHQARRENAQAFDLSADLPIRATLMRLGEKDHVLSLIVHHIAFDGWSTDVFRRELGAIYQAFVGGQPSPLAALTLQYSDYSAWQRQWLSDETLQWQVDYWRRQLDGIPAQLELPTDRPRPSVQDYRGARRTMILGSKLVQAIRSLSRQEGATPFMTLLAAFQILLARYAGQEQVVVGIPTAGRTHRELEVLVGCFVNTLALRADLSGRPTFRQFLAQIRETCLEAYVHQDVPFEKLVAELQPTRSLSHPPLFQVMFQLRVASGATGEFGGLSVERIHVDPGVAQFDLSFDLAETASGLDCRVDYSTALFEAGTVDRLLEHFQVLLEGVVANPDCPVTCLPLLTAAEREQILVTWNDTAAEYPRDRCLHHCFEEQAKETPNVIALHGVGEALTYRQLDDRANRLAGHLNLRGVAPGDLVGIYLERSPAMVVALLAVLKAGAAYLPLDPDFPQERLRFMAEDSGLRVLLVHENLPQPQWGAVAEIVLLSDAGCLHGPSMETAARARVGAADDLAYVLYTSGSTGRPKGVAVTHGSVLNLLWAMKGCLGEGVHEVVLGLTTLSFDISMLEIFLPLLNGGRLELVQKDITLDALQLAEVIYTRGVTLLQATPATWRLLLQVEWRGSQNLTAICGGEALSVALARAIAPRVRRLVNAYGPTETTIWSTAHTVNELDDPVPIGRPLANTQVFVLDAEMHPVPIGVPGELYLGGVGVARGYLNRAQQTAERFVPNPFANAPGNRLYRTGDAVRWRSDGSLEYLGRLDRQIKIRGFRIEPGEVEAALVSHRSIAEAAVVLREDRPGDQRLVAYFVPHGQDGSTESLREHLRGRLPDYMIPSAFVRLTRLPLTPNGKLDRAGLPVPESSRPAEHLAYEAPRGPDEETLAKIWAEVLGVDQVGVHDNFFDLGGHSLLAVQLQHRIQQALGWNLSVAAFFQAPTIREFAALTKRRGDASEGVHLFTPDAPYEPAPLFWLHFLSTGQKVAKHFQTERRVYGIALPLDTALRRWHSTGERTISLEELADLAVVGIRHVQPQGPYHLAGFCFGGVLAFEVARRIAIEGQQVSLLALLDATYMPGCRRLPFPWLRRALHHFKETLLHPAYLRRKLIERRRVQKRREEALARLQNDPALQGSDAGPNLPLASLQSAILHAYVGQPFAGDAVVFRGTRGPHFNFAPGPTSGWHRVVHGKLHVEELPCNQLEISREPFVGEMALRLKRYFSDVDNRIG